MTDPTIFVGIGFAAGVVFHGGARLAVYQRDADEADGRKVVTDGGPPAAPVTDGEVTLGRNATLYHEEFGPITRVTNGVRAGTVRFEVERVDTPTIYVEYTAAELAERWGEWVFEDPDHAAAVGGDRDA